MSKLQGLKVLAAHFNFQAQQTGHMLLYKNLPAEKLLHHQLGMALALLVAQECQDIAWALGLMRADCLHGIAGTVPEEYDPSFDGDGNPALDAPRPYDAYAEMGYYMAADYTPYGLSLDLSPGALDAVGSLIASKSTLKAYAKAKDMELVTRDSDEGEWRPMTELEITQYARRESNQAMEDCLFTVGFNEDMARLRKLIAERGSLTEILELIGPEPVPELPF
ncbi:MAG: hypothetical protein ACRYFZ_07295 [Janthinobacterium lividum]